MMTFAITELHFRHVQLTFQSVFVTDQYYVLFNALFFRAFVCCRLCASSENALRA